MIFDEATAALDAETERKLQRALASARGDAPPSSSRIASPPYAMPPAFSCWDGGRVIESGSFDELVARDGAFAVLARAQFMTADRAAQHEVEATLAAE